MAETPSDPPPSVETAKRADEARVAATGAAFRSRAKRVQMLRRVLPLIVLVLAGGTIGWIVFRSVLSGVERNSSQNQEVRLDNALFHGQDAQGRSFTIGAEGAIRDPETGRFRLVGPALKLNLGAGRVTELTADGGAYDETARTVIIGPNVRIADGRSGMVLVTPEAVVDTRTGQVSGNKGVQGSGPLGTISASSYVIQEDGGRISFSGSGENKVRGTINPARSR